MAEVQYSKVHILSNDDPINKVTVVWNIRSDVGFFVATGSGPDVKEACRKAIQHGMRKSGFPKWYLEMVMEDADVQEPLI